MTILRIFLFLGLVLHKVVWEVLKKPASSVAPTAPRPASGLKSLVKLVKVGVLLFLVVQTLFLNVFPISFSARLRSPEKLMEEMWQLKRLGIHNIHMYADLFTVSREQVVELCQRMIAEKLDVHWTCNSRVDFVDEELLRLMGQAGCRLISWGIESGNEQILKHARKGAYPDKAERSLKWAKAAGIMNWGYFIIGLPGETEDTIRQTIDFAKKLPLDIALFHVAAPYPGTPFFFEVVQNGWFRPGTRWEQVDMDKGTVLDYPNLPAERLLYWQKQAFREWALRPGPAITYAKMLLTDWNTMKTALNVGFQHLRWILRGGQEEASQAQPVIKLDLRARRSG